MKAGSAIAIKVVSVLGAGVGSNTFGQISDPNSSLDWSAVGDHLGSLVPLLRDELKAVAQGWIDSYLKKRLTEVYSKAKNPDPTRNNDDDFVSWYNSYDGGDELRRIVWEQFVFPIPALAYNDGQQGLKVLLIKQLTKVKYAYETQYKAYINRASSAYIMWRGSFHGFNVTWEEFRTQRYPRFNFILVLEGLPPEFLKAQERRLRILQSQLLSGTQGERILGIPGAHYP
jgi:hypothetical protein